MFTSRSIMFALISFLAGANACVQCPATVRVGGSTKKLRDTNTLDNFTYCNYDDVTLYSSTIYCMYHPDNGKLVADQFDFCPAAATVKDH
ncbi:uncharacterized protein EDB91DRAFT_1147068, partial [Suillus paluster]|uniref:uncharacterized protein n=1 Tax=Suillus paluster TaxID=48578 RepID=UPI001B87F7A7